MMVWIHRFDVAAQCLQQVAAMGASKGIHQSQKHKRMYFSRKILVKKMRTVCWSYLLNAPRTETDGTDDIEDTSVQKLEKIKTQKALGRA